MYYRDQLGSMDSVLAVHVDDYIYTGTTSHTYEVKDFLFSRFDISKFARGTLQLMGYEVTHGSDFRVNLS